MVVQQTQHLVSLGLLQLLALVLLNPLQVAVICAPHPRSTCCYIVYYYNSIYWLCLTSYGVTVFTPWLSSSLCTLDLAFGPGIHDMVIVSCLLYVRRLCTHVSSLVITDSSNCSQRRDGIINDVISGFLEGESSLTPDLVVLLRRALWDAASGLVECERWYSVWASLGGNRSHAIISIALCEMLIEIEEDDLRVWG